MQSAEPADPEGQILGPQFVSTVAYGEAQTNVMHSCWNTLRDDGQCRVGGRRKYNCLICRLYVECACS